jgi:hypothetical protein
MRTRLKKILAAPFILLAAIVVLFEDWLWDDLLRLMAALGRLPGLRQVEQLIAALPPYGALAAFGLPTLLLLPVKLAAFWLVAHKQAALGLGVIIAAKLVGTALLARIYALTHPQLLRIAWFAALHARYVSFKMRVYAALKATRIYQFLHQHKLRLKAWFKEWREARARGLLRKRWIAAVRLLRKWRRIAE